MHFHLISEKSFDRGPKVIGVSGELDLHAAPMLEERITRLLDRGTVHLEVDLRETTFMDSSGVRVLANAHRLLHERGGSLGLVCDDPHILKVIELTGLHELVPVRSAWTGAPFSLALAA
jgi:anti-sigma B factor antagonist